jgi:D-3-phosphoglycerate dehydrogenase
MPTEMSLAKYVIDFDSTIITCESLDELAAIALRGRADRASALLQLQNLTNLGMAGKLAFDESLQKRLELFAPTDKHIHELVAKLGNCITPSFWDNRDWLKANADRIYVISGGFEECIIPIIEKLGLRADHVLANAFTTDGRGTATGHDTSRHLSKAGGKISQVRALALPGPVIAIGDGYTDYEIRKSDEATAFWYFAENIERDAVMPYADRVLHSFSEVVHADQNLQPLASRQA